MASACAGALALAPGSARAAETRYHFVIPPKATGDALIDLGIQANLSIVGTQTCGASRSALLGVYTVREALRRMLAGAPCGFLIVDPRTVRIAALPRPPVAIAAPERPAAPEPVFVAELLVTATKRPAALDRLPAGVSALSGSQIELTGAADVGRTTGQLAGVLTTNLGPARDKLLIRGISDGAFTGRARSTVGTYLDETPINFNAPDPDLRLVDVARIEVVRGPQGALYGSGAISGIYKIVTEKPRLSEYAGRLAGLASVTGGGDPSYAVEGVVNLPVVPDRAALRLAAYHDVQGGYLDDVNLRLENVDRTQRDGGRAALRVQFTQDWQADVAFTAQRLRSSDTQYAVAGAGAEARQRSNRVREGHKNNFGQLAATVRGELGFASLSTTAALVRHVYSSVYDATPVVVETFGAQPSDIGLFSENARVEMAVGDAVLRSARPGPVSWLVGLYGANTRERLPSTLDVVHTEAGAGRVYGELRRDKLREYALYGEASYELAPGWTVLAGGRWFDSHVEVTSKVKVNSPGVSRASANSRSFDGFSPKVSLQREFGSGNLAYALYSEGYRAGGFNSGGILTIRPSRTSFQPDQLKNYELGAKLRLLDRRLSVRAAAFYDDWSNIQTDQYRPTGLAFTGNVGDARILGLEAELGYDFGFGLSLQLNGLLSNSEITRANPDFPIPGGGVTDSLPGVPKISGGMLASYRREMGPWTLRLIGEASYVGRSAVSFDTAIPQKQGGYLRSRLSAEVANGRWSAGVFISNPTDDSGDTFAYGNPFSFATVRQVTPQRPRTVGVRLAAGF